MTTICGGGSIRCTRQAAPETSACLVLVVWCARAWMRTESQRDERAQVSGQPTRPCLSSTITRHMSARRTLMAD
jgi:hypothetical protein